MSVRNAVIVAVVVASLLSLPGLAAKPFHTRGEPREAVVAQAILRNDEWILPRRYDNLIPTKPPLTHWISAGAAELVGGSSEFTARLPSAVMSILLIGLLTWFVSTHLGAGVGLVSGVVTATSVEWYRAAVTARVDMTLASLSVIVIIGLFQSRLAGGFGWSLLAAVGAAGAALAKGPVGLLLPLTLFGAFAALDRDSLWKTGFKLSAFALVAAILPAWWYLEAYARGGSEFAAVVNSENLRRFVGTMDDDPHSHGLFYLPGTLLVGLLPWTAILGGWLIRSLRAGNFAERYRAAPAVIRLSIVVTVGSLVFYSIPESKRSVYLLLSYPFYGILIAWMMQLALHRPEVRWTLRGLPWLTVAATAVIAVVLLTAVPVPLLREPQRELLETLRQGAFVAFSRTDVALLALLCAIVSVVSLFLRDLLVRGATAVVSIMVALNTVYLPLVGDALSVKRFIPEIRELVRDGRPIFGYGRQFFDVSFYLNRAMTTFAGDVPAGGAFVVVDEEDMQALHELVDPACRLAVLWASPRGVMKAGEQVFLVELVLVAELTDGGAA